MVNLLNAQVNYDKTTYPFNPSRLIKHIGAYRLVRASRKFASQQIATQQRMFKPLPLGEMK